MRDSLFDVDFRRLIADALTRPLRKGFWVDWFAALLKPAFVIHAEFIQLREKLLEETKANSQRLALEVFLRRKMQATINIVLNVKTRVILLIPANDSRTRIVSIGANGVGSNHPLVPSMGLVNDGPDFTVLVPSEFSTSQRLRVRKLVTDYKTYGTTFNIANIDEPIE